MSEWLAMCTAGSIQVGKVGGGIATITPEMVIAALSGKVTRQVYLYSLAKFCLDENVLPELQALNVEPVLYRAKLRKRKVNSNERHYALVELADMALALGLTSPTCPTCQGAGISNDQTTCKSCNGVGLKPKSGGRQLAEQLGVSHHAWRYRWGRWYAEIVSDYLAWESYVDYEIRRQIFYVDSRAVQI